MRSTRAVFGRGGLDVEPFGTRWKGTITLVTMSFFACLGFYVQNKLIQRFYEGDEAAIHMRAKEIKRLEILALAEAAGDREALTFEPQGGRNMIGGSTKR